MGKFLKSFVYAFRGVLAGVKGQRNIQIMLAIGGLAIVLGYYFRISRIEWAVVAVASGLVLAVELLNTAGEKLVDILSPGFDSRYGEVKDIMAAASLVAAVGAGFVGALIFGEDLYHLLLQFLG